jgi:hypothetical protein
LKTLLGIVNDWEGKGNLMMPGETDYITKTIKGILNTKGGATKKNNTIELGKPLSATQIQRLKQETINLNSKNIPKVKKRIFNWPSKT